MERAHAFGFSPAREYSRRLPHAGRLRAAEEFPHEATPAGKPPVVVLRHRRRPELWRAGDAEAILRVAADLRQRGRHELLPDRGAENLHATRAAPAPVLPGCGG